MYQHNKAIEVKIYGLPILVIRFPGGHAHVPRNPTTTEAILEPTKMKDTNLLAMLYHK